VKKPRFSGNLLIWPIARDARTYRIYVVEPETYSPQEHGSVFRAALTALISQVPSLVDPFTHQMTPPRAEPFDLVTFPEAFLAQDDLLSVLRLASTLDSLGCVHVGLRPKPDGDSHLFEVNELSRLVESLSSIPQTKSADLSRFSDWLKAQHNASRFNIGCLFAIDADHQLRVCLHPKVVRSKVEVSPLHEGHMTEADLLTLVTLSPTEKALFSVTLQPLLCSDALRLSTDRPHSWPLEGANADAACFGQSPPDHVDIISVATCTPQLERRTPKGGLYRMWHPEFREAFRRAASDDALGRHHFAVFVLANFRTLPESTPGGLSGAFMPVSYSNSYPDIVSVSAYGKPRSVMGAENGWSEPDGSAHEQRSDLGHVASLTPFVVEDGALARMLGFTIHRLPRDAMRWGHIHGLTDFQFQVAIRDPASGEMNFGKREVSDD
jgi:hypothetical protein